MDDLRDEPRTGIWLHPAGTRIDTTRHNDGWHIAIYAHDYGGRPGHEFVFTDPAEVEAKLAELEAQGYAYLSEQDSDSDDWSIWQILAGVGVLALLVLIGILAFS